MTCSFLRFEEVLRHVCVSDHSPPSEASYCVWGDRTNACTFYRLCRVQRASQTRKHMGTECRTRQSSQFTQKQTRNVSSCGLNTSEFLWLLWMCSNEEKPCHMPPHRHSGAAGVTDESPFLHSTALYCLSLVTRAWTLCLVSLRRRSALATGENPNTGRIQSWQHRSVASSYEEQWAHTIYSRQNPASCRLHTITINILRGGIIVLHLK